MLTYEFTKYRHGEDVTLPFELHFKMPPTDLGKKGYSPQYAERLATSLR